MFYTVKHVCFFFLTPIFIKFILTNKQNLHLTSVTIIRSLLMQSFICSLYGPIVSMGYVVGQKSLTARQHTTISNCENSRTVCKAGGEVVLT